MWFRRKQPVSAPFDASLLPEDHPGTLEHMISEGVMLAEYAGRMALKNHIVVGALTEPKPYTPERYRDPARAVLADLVRMAEASASLAEGQREAAAKRQGASQHEHDYRARDTANLRRREDVNAAVAAHLAAMRDDREYLARFIERAREDAWADVGEAITARLDQEWPSLPEHPEADVVYDTADSDRRRNRRMRRLRRDVARLVKRGERVGVREALREWDPAE